MKFKKIMKLIIIVFSFIIIVTMLKDALLYNEIQNYEDSWNIELPAKMTNIYKWNNQDASFHGDGIRYSKYKLVELNQRLLSDYIKTKNIVLENYIRNLMNENNIQDDQKVNFNLIYSWKVVNDDQNSLLIIYMLESQELFLIQITT